MKGLYGMMVHRIKLMEVVNQDIPIFSHAEMESCKLCYKLYLLSNQMTK